MMQMDKEAWLAKCNAACANTLMETLEIKYTDIGEDYVVASMPVNPRVHQPDGVLHGGAMVALAESVGSVASFLFVDGSKYMVRGIEISANHVKSIREGMVYAKAKVVHKGRTTQLWEIRLTDEAENLISICKLTTLALPRK
ncbi:thioesterase [Sediminicola luteus]|uniref:Thioesterase n=2 Tax=Sediminicola luteus TaxID=319238 RepID=A0A2A4G636_9FLAO|nr:thioesterase [Sediminicola luteus]